MNNKIAGNLGELTSLRVGGQAEELVLIENSVDFIKSFSDKTCKNVLGFGCNVLISDQGLDGKTIVWRGGDIQVIDDILVADAGVWWDNLVKRAMLENLWGIELMSGIPSSVGGAIIGNIAAYGQQVSDSLLWVEILNKETLEISKKDKTEFDFTYRQSSLQENPDNIVIRSGFKLSKQPINELKYDSALDIERELWLDHKKLQDCRKIIIETRSRAGSMYHPDDPDRERTAGSAFKNPLLSLEKAREIAKFDESGKTLERIENQNKIHGGSQHRASAAHVLLACGFKRGQTWNKVRLHNDHVLKVETLPGATATEVYDVMQEIIRQAKDKLDVNLEPEIKFLGKF